jgi:hypothetical protein
MKAPGASRDETRTLKRNTTSPIQDFVILPLEPDSVRPIIVAVGGTVPNSILHIQIEKHGMIQFGLYDCFHPEAMFFGPLATT